MYQQDLNSAMGPAQRAAHPNAITLGAQQAAAYVAVSPRLHMLTCTLTSQATRKFFLNLYESPKQGVVAIKARVWGLIDLDECTAASCQYCSGLGPPEELDHFLEKAIVPELALYAPNLVPSCGACNNIRGRKPTFAKNGRRRALHFYDDPIETLPELLVAKISMEAGVPKATYSVAPSTHPLRAVFARHFATLQLQRRYGREAAAQLKLIRVRAQTTKTNATGLVRWLRHEAKARVAAYGRNDHRATLFRTIAASKSAIAWAVKP